jgi:hypothetical protein
LKADRELIAWLCAVSDYDAAVVGEEEEEEEEVDDDDLRMTGDRTNAWESG